MTTLLDGKAVAEGILHELGGAVRAVEDTYGRAPLLALLAVGKKPAAQHYLRRKMREGRRIGIHCELITLPEAITQAELTACLEQLNSRGDVNGILVQLPLPSHLCTETTLAAIAPDKDVDGLNPWNLGKVFWRREPPLPCLPWAVIELLERYAVPMQGRHAVVLGDDPFLGKLIAMLLLQKQATVSLCPWGHPALPILARRGDLLITTGGRPRGVTPDLVQPRAIVIDAGMNYEDGYVIGDVDTAAVEGVAAMLSPTPGGVGPLIITTLLMNTFAVFLRQYDISWDWERQGMGGETMGAMLVARRAEGVRW